MHDLLQEMGREFVCEESKEPGERSRLWDSQDIYQVFKNNTGTRNVEGIFLNVSKLRKEIYLNPKAFGNMSNLKFLKIYNFEEVEGLEKAEECKVYLPQGLDYLPNGLRYLYWYRYPLEYLPANFCPEDPLLIELPHSNFRGLWKEAEPESIFKHFSSLSQFSTVTSLRLVSCDKLTRLPDTVAMECLYTLDLSGCKRLNMFPEISRKIKYMYLCGTAIKKVPSSIENLDQLVELNLDACSQLVSLPRNICKLKHLKSLDLKFCSELKIFPEILESMDNLEQLDLSWTAIEELPSSVDNVKGLKSLKLEGCTNLASLASWLGMSCLTLSRLSSLSLAYCKLWELPADLGRLSALTDLSLSGNNFESIPESIKQLAQLQSLRLYRCERLRSLPELPMSLLQLDASGCTSLENISSLNQLLSDRRSLLLDVNLLDSFQVDENGGNSISQLGIHYLEKYVIRNDDGKWLWPRIFVCYTGGRMPEWCVNQSTGDSVRVPLPTNWLHNAGYLGFIICLVIECYCIPHIQLQCNCLFGDDCDDDSDFSFTLDEMPLDWVTNFGSRTEQIVMLFAYNLYDRIAENCPRLTQRSYDSVLLNFKPCERCVPHPFQYHWKVKKCGAIPLYAQDEEYNPVKPSDTFADVSETDEIFRRGSRLESSST